MALPLGRGALTLGLSEPLPGSERGRGANSLQADTASLVTVPAKTQPCTLLFDGVWWKATAIAVAVVCAASAFVCLPYCLHALSCDVLRCVVLSCDVVLCRRAPQRTAAVPLWRCVGPSGRGIWPKQLWAHAGESGPHKCTACSRCVVCLFAGLFQRRLSCFELGCWRPVVKTYSARMESTDSPTC